MFQTRSSSHRPLAQDTISTYLKSKNQVPLVEVFHWVNRVLWDHRKEILFPILAICWNAVWGVYQARTPAGAAARVSSRPSGCA